MKEYKEIDELVNPTLSTRSTSYELEDNIKSGSLLMNAVMWVWRPLSLILADYLGTNVKQSSKGCGVILVGGY
jgi:hypothetical protein